MSHDDFGKYTHRDIYRYLLSSMIKSIFLKNTACMIEERTSMIKARVFPNYINMIRII